MGHIDVTIGIPVHNESKYLSKAIESALNQSYKNIKILISENNSSDSSLQIAKKYEELDGRIEVISHSKTLLPFDNFNVLLKASNTKYFIWLGGHDVIHENLIQAALEVFNTNEKIVCVYPKSAYIENDIFLDSEMSDDLNTLNLTVEERIKKVIANISYGNAVYGVYKREILVKSFLDVNGGDLLILLKAASMGFFTSTNNIGYYFRVIRKVESERQTLERYLKLGFLPNWREVHSMYPYEVVAGIRKISVFSKIKLFFEIKLLMYKFTKEYSWKPILTYFINRKKLKIVFLILLSKLRN